ncbi:MAG: S28 family serine protease, partial [Bdellovibrionota bacterium]
MRLINARLFVGISILGTIVFQSGSTAWADARDHYLRKFYEARKQAEMFPFLGEVESSAITATFDQNIDPSDPKDPRTFKQRYFYNSNYAEGVDAPVFLFVCGEGACSSSDLNGSIQELAKTFKAHLIAL